MIVLNNDQQDKLVEQFVELQVDSMDMESLVEWVTDELILKYEKLTKEELKERIDCYQDDLFDELVDNVTNEIAQPKVTITPQQLEGDISTVTDDDYADKVDTLVGNMVASDDNETAHNTTLGRENRKKWLYNYTHDSESC